MKLSPLMPLPGHNYLDQREIAARREGAVMGCWLGVFLAAVIVVVSSIALDLWRERNHARLVAEADAKITAELAECQEIARDLADEEYGVVRDLQRNIKAARGER